MKIKLSKQAEKFIRKQDKKTVQRILLTIEGLKNKPFIGDIKLLKGRNELRLRIGDIRIIFEEKDKEIHILLIGNRGDIYKK
jgi:mRNA interferase RelE/StbE